MKDENKGLLVALIILFICGIGVIIGVGGIIDMVRTGL
jgi:hypothetical protein